MLRDGYQRVKKSPYVSWEERIPPTAVPCKLMRALQAAGQQGDGQLAKGHQMSASLSSYCPPVTRLCLLISYSCESLSKAWSDRISSVEETPVLIVISRESVFAANLKPHPCKSSPCQCIIHMRKCVGSTASVAQCAVMLVALQVLLSALSCW
jgi:hypothetical protein